MWDNSPPNLPVARLIRQWNETGLQPRIRYVTPEELSDRIHRIPADHLPLLSGDWTDYWNFGCASTAASVARSRSAKRALNAARTLAAAERPVAVHRAEERALDLLDLFDEHTWSYWDTAPGVEAALVQDTLKAATAVEAGELASYVLVDALEARRQSGAVGRPARPRPAGQPRALTAAGVGGHPGRLVPAGAAAALRTLPASPRPGLPDLRAGGPAGRGRAAAAPCGPAAGTRRSAPAARGPRTPVQVRAFNNVRLETARKGDARIVSPRHELTYDPATGRILQLVDLELGWPVLPEGTEFSLFDFVRERPDALYDARREAYYERDLEREKFDLSCWKPWRAVRERATRVTECTVTRTVGSITLDRCFEAPGCASCACASPCAPTRR
ncbi:MAG: hypothetical protein U1F77_04625 [Kiritimatiellia bacterium]